MWSYNGKEFTSEDIGDYYGFVYCITNTETGKKYIGKKFFISSRTKTVKGKKKKFKVESDWKNYYGSNAVLQKEAAANPEKYQREILHLCMKKADCSYYEIKEQIERNVLFDDNYYNEFIGCRIHQKHLTRT